jgi:hypothetical protein
MKKRQRQTQILLTIILFVLLIATLLLIPRTRSFIDWQWIKAKVYIQDKINPIEAPPTPNIVASSTPPMLPTATLAPPTATPDLSTPTPLPTATATPLPQNVLLDATYHEFQDMNNCGPASLSMYLHYYGWQGDQFDVFDFTKTERADRNVNIEEMDYFVRMNAGWLTTQFRVGGTIDLLKKFIANGIPVLTETSFSFDESYYSNDDRWAGHYQYLIGYDDSIQSFTIQDSYYGPDQVKTYQDFKDEWQSFNYVFMLIYLPTQADLVTEILGDYNTMEASRNIATNIALKEIEQDPEDIFAWFNLATNQTYFEEYATAADTYDHARSLGLPQRMFRYQFGPFLAYYHSGRTEDLLDLLDYALQVTPNSEEALLWKGWAEYRLGNNQAAVNAFLEAYKNNSKSTDVLYALDYMGIPY